MRTYHRMEAAADLPAAGPLSHAASEGPQLDFKQHADAGKMIEHAKDVAGFANALGGVILVGADDHSGQLEYLGVKGQTVKDVQQIYDQAAQLCSPQPAVFPIPIEVAAGVSVVAVNVDPFVDQIVASPAKGRGKNGAEIRAENAWVFPIRIGSQTEFVKPENLAMYMGRDVRRAVLLLSSIPVDARRNVLLHFALPNQPIPRHWSVTLVRVDLGGNTVHFAQSTGRTTVSVRVPLMAIEDVWEHVPGEWAVQIIGFLMPRDPSEHDMLGEMLYVPPMRLRR